MMAFVAHWLLPVLLLVPAVGAGVVRAIPWPRASRRTALGVALTALALSLVLAVPIHSGAFARFGSPAAYGLAITGLSYPFVVLATFVSAIALAAAARGNGSRKALAMMLVLETATLGALVASNLIVLYAFAALTLWPATSLAAGGGAWARGAPSKVFAYLLIGLVCLLVVVLGEYALTRQAFGRGTFDLLQLASPAMQRQLAKPQFAGASRTLFALAMVGFLVRLPVVPLHGWLVETVEQAPLPAALLIATLVPAGGAYGILRVAYPLFPAAGASLWKIFSALAVGSSIYAALCAIAQDDLRRTIGYAAVSMSAFALLGASLMNPAADAAAVYLEIFVALGTSMLLLLSRAGTSGASAGFTAFWTFGWLAWLVVPGLLGQTLIVLGIPRSRSPGSILAARAGSSAFACGLAAGACLAIVLTGAYVVSAARRLFHSAAPPSGSAELCVAERIELYALSAALLALGVLPGPLCLSLARPALEALFRSIQALRAGA